MKKILFLGLFLILGLEMVAQASCDGCLRGQYKVLSITQGSTTTLTTDTSTTPMWYTFMTDSSVIVFNFSGSFTIPVGMTGRLLMIPHGRTEVLLSYRITANDSCNLVATPDPMTISGRYCWDSLVETMTSISTAFVFERNNWDLDSMHLSFVPQCPATEPDTIWPNLQIAEDSLVFWKSQGMPEWQLAIKCAQLVHRSLPYGLLAFDGNFDGNNLSLDSIKARVNRGETAICGGFSYVVGLLSERILDSTCYARVSLGYVANQQNLEGHVIGVFIAPRDTGDLWIYVDPLTGTYLRRADREPLDYRKYLSQMYGSPNPFTGDFFLTNPGIRSLYRQRDSCLLGQYVMRGASVRPFIDSTYLVLGYRQAGNYFSRYPAYDSIFVSNANYWGYAHVPHAINDTIWIPALYRGIYGLHGNTCAMSQQQLDDSIRGFIYRAIVGTPPLYYPIDSIDEEHVAEFENKFSVWPNPTTGIVNVHATQYQQQGKVRLQIANVLGHVVFEDSQEYEYSGSIDMSARSKGLYFVTAIHTDGSRLTKKVLLQ